MTDERSDYPEPEGATETCVYCGRRTYSIDGRDGRPLPSRDGTYLVAFRVHCARTACLDASEADPNWAVHFPLGHLPS